jgi:hypothetical protein
MPVEEQPVSKEMVGKRRLLLRRSQVFNGFLSGISPERPKSSHLVVRFLASLRQKRQAGAYQNLRNLYHDTPACPNF